jgi:hypothetical protein
MIEIVRKAKKEACFYCGRTKKDLLAQFDIKSIQDEIKSQITTKNKKYDKIHKEFKKFLKNLYEDTKDYPESYTLFQVNHSEENIIQTIPRIDELSDFGSKENGKENEWITIKELQDNLQIFIEDIDNNKIPDKIREFTPDWAEKILENLPIEEDNLTFRSPIVNLEIQSIVKISDINGNPVSTDYKNEEIEYYSILNKKHIDHNHILMVIYEYYICGVCEETMKSGNTEANLPNGEPNYWE